MKVLLFGTGDYYNRYKKWFAEQEILALLDNSRQKQNTLTDGHVVLSPEEGVRLHYDVIVIVSFYVKQMKQQLLSLGVDREKIFHFYDLHWLLAGKIVPKPIQCYLEAENIIKGRETKRIKVLLMSHDLTFGGPAIALFHAAIVLQKYGYTVIYASMLDGPLKDKLIENDISVIVDENLQIATMQETDWVNGFSLIICNTVNFYVFLSERNTKIPVIWWLHDAAFFYEGVNGEIMGKISRHNLRVVCAGPVPADAVRKFLPDLNCEELLYGVADRTEDGSKAEYFVCDYAQSPQCTSGIVRFVTIGFLEKRKGQDILLQAIQNLSDEVRQRSRFYIVGHKDTMFGEHIQDKSADISEIIFTGSVDRERVHELLSCADILVCPSRQDPMPTVVTEAMMHSVPCIISDVTGTAAYIQNGIDGFVFSNENVQHLAEKIKWCVNNRNELEDMGRKARKIYEKYFSMEAFEKKFLEVVKETLFM